MKTRPAPGRRDQALFTNSHTPPAICGGACQRASSGWRVWRGLPALLLLLLHSAADARRTPHLVEGMRPRHRVAPVPGRVSPPSLELEPALEAWSSPEEDEWCHGQGDGLHADLLADPPCSGYFRCSWGILTGLFPCPLGLFFSQPLGHCTPRNISSCATRARMVRGGRGGRARSLEETQADTVVRIQYWQEQGRGKPRALAETSDMNALLAFKAANLDPLGVLRSWVVSGPSPTKSMCQSWYGVTCNDKQRVKDLQLGAGTSPICSDTTFFPNGTLWGNVAIGQSIPPAFGDLSALETLDLSCNFNPATLTGGLVGTIPTALGRCTNLLYLDLGYNSLEGPIPENLSNLTKLDVLRLSYNFLTESVPSSLGKLEELNYLDLSANKLSSSLPGELGQLSNLLTLYLKSNPNISGSIPEGLSRLSALTALALDTLNLTGSLPLFWAEMRNLSYLSLNNNNLSGPIPTSLGLVGLDYPGSSSTGMIIQLGYNELTGGLSPALLSGLCSPHRTNHLIALSLYDNQLSGSIPTGIAQCTGLTLIDLNNNQLSGPLPAASVLSKLSLLKVLNLAQNQLAGEIPVSMFSMKSLQAVNFSLNNLTGPLPPVPCSTKVFSVDVHENRLSGNLSSSLGPTSPLCPGLCTLDVSGNSFSGPFPGNALTFQGCAVTLNLQDNQLSGPLPSPKSCPNLQNLNASGNHLQGQLAPTLLSACSALENLDLSNNLLSGPAPKSVGGSQGLFSLSLAGNELTGAVPDSFFSGLRLIISLDLSRNALQGPIPTNLSGLQQLSSLSLSHNLFDGTIPSAIQELSVLASLSLASNALSGPIPDNLIPQNFPNLIFLDLSYNQLSGVIPYGYANISNFSGLVVDFSNNNLSGLVPGQLADQPEAVSDNPLLCGGAGYSPCPTTQNGLSSAQLAGIIVGVIIAVLLMVLFTWWILRPKDEWTGGTMLVFEKLDFPLTGKDILDMTGDFSDKYLLGSGGFGAVYRASLQDGRVVAIKRLKEGSSQGNKEFEAEITSLGNIRHRNLVTLVAAYIAAPPSKERVLLYDFMPGGSLDRVLDCEKELPEDSPFRKWTVRKNIALDVARGMQYLHHDCQPQIIHRDMKPANVLLDDQMAGRVADFGLAREADASKTHLSTAVYGTVGYLAPEYVRDGRLSFKSDVYAFGVTLLQMVTARRPTDKEVSERGLSRWVSCQSTDQVIDPRMVASPEDMVEIRGAIKLGLLCTSKVPVDRPSMNEAYHLLSHLADFAENFGAE